MKYKFLLRYYHVKYLIKSKFASFILNIANFLNRRGQSTIDLATKLVTKSSKISTNTFNEYMKNLDKIDKALDLGISNEKVLEDVVDQFNDDFPEYPSRLDDILNLPPTIDTLPARIASMYDDRGENLDDCDASIDA